MLFHMPAYTRTEEGVGPWGEGSTKKHIYIYSFFLGGEVPMGWGAQTGGR